MILRFLGLLLARYLNRPISNYVPPTTNSLESLKTSLRPGDVLLVEGNLRVSSAIKYLTQSTWSHSALFIGQVEKDKEDSPSFLLEADLETGVVLVPLSKYSNFHTRICRPVGLSKEDQNQVIKFALSAVGNKYDLKNIIDLLRYLMPIPPVPSPWRRKLLSFGSGEPTEAICSTLIAQAFQSIHYPILPKELSSSSSKGSKKMILKKYRIRHHTLFTPRDFDISPYFEVIKPTIEQGFQYREFQWE